MRPVEGRGPKCQHGRIELLEHWIAPQVVLPGEFPRREIISAKCSDCGKDMPQVKEYLNAAP